jgi:hypothetical protein
MVRCASSSSIQFPAVSTTTGAYLQDPILNGLLCGFTCSFRSPLMRCAPAGKATEPLRVFPRGVQALTHTDSLSPVWALGVTALSVALAWIYAHTNGKCQHAQITPSSKLARPNPERAASRGSARKTAPSDLLPCLERR